MTVSPRGILAALARPVPWSPDPDPELARALGYLGWAVDAETVQRAGDAAGALVGVALGTLAVAFGLGTAGRCGALVAGACVAAGARAVPRVIATTRRTRALGEAPGLVSRAALRMRLSPTPETAAAFAADTGRGRLAESLSDHVERASGTGRTGLSAFADEWAAWFPALRRALTLVESAGNAPPDERRRALDGALDVILQGTRETAAEFASSVRGPATALYAFGVLLPLALVALLPAAGTVGLDVSAVAVVVGYDLLLPAVLVAASGWLLARRPVAFPPARIRRSHPEVPDGRWRGPAAGVVGGVAGWTVATHAVAPWAKWIAAPGLAFGAGLFVAYRPTTDVRERVEEIERGLPDALYLVGREVDRGRSVEAAMEDAADALDSATGSVFAAATRKQRQLKAGVRESLVGEYGAFASVPSQRGRGTAELLALAAAEGRPAGQAVVAMADHLDDLRTVEERVRRELRQVTSTLRNTAAVFGPLVGGATVTLAGRMSADGPLSGGFPVATLGLAVGAYVLALAVVLTALATGLERGLDRSLVGYRAGRSLVAATVVFCTAIVATRWLV
ncbi:MAG: type II secretion system protein [Haloarculaceae archaeon]